MKRGLYMRTPDVVEEKASDAMVKLAMDRTGEILKAWCGRRDVTGRMTPIEVLVQSAYFQGAADMATATMRGDVNMPLRRAAIREYL